MSSVTGANRDFYDLISAQWILFWGNVINDGHFDGWEKGCGKFECCLCLFKSQLQVKGIEM